MPETQAMPPITAYWTSSTEPTTPYWPNPTFDCRSDNSTPPVAAIPAATAKAYSLTPTTLMPSDAAARSLLRTASSAGTDPASTEVGHHESHEDEHDEHEPAVALRMLDGVEVQAEERHAVDRQSAQPARHGAVGEQRAR